MWPRAVMFITTATGMYSLGHVLRTLPAMSRSTQPSTILGVKCLSGFGLSNNKWGWWMWMVAVYWQTHSPSWLVWFEGWRRVATRCSVCIHQMNWVNSCNGYGHDDSHKHYRGIIIIIIIIIIIFYTLRCISPEG